MIHDTNECIDFENKITFLSPKSVSSGSYIIKCFAENQKPLFIQSPKCKSKQGFMKAGKKLYCDLVFSCDDESFLKWIEEFEAFCQKKIFDNRSIWFDSELEMHDIENSFLPSLKIFKSGKQHILRANIPLHLGKCGLKIYNEDEEDVIPETIVENSNLMTILEIQGIKCSSRSFQIEYEIKQMMLLNPVDIFEKCVFSVKHKQIKEEPKKQIKEEPKKQIKEEPKKQIKEEPKKQIKEEPKKETQNESDDENENDLGNVSEYENESNYLNDENTIDINQTEVSNHEIEQNDLGKNIHLENDLCEIDLEIPSLENNDIMQLKNRNKVYFEMYREAKRKARLAREFAFSAYLEANRIKNTYLLDEAFDSDDEKEIEEKSLENMKI